MDGYAQSMLNDNTRHNEGKIPCPKCSLELTLRTTDEFIKCKRCGEIFYIEEIKNNESHY